MTTTLPRAQPTPSLVPYLHELQQATGADVVLGGLAGDGNTPVVLDTFLGTRSEGLHNLQIVAGLGLGGKAMSIGRPLRVRDYLVASGITHEYDAGVRMEGLHAMFAVPIRTPDGVHGVIYGAQRRPELIGDRLLVRAVGVAHRFQHDAAVAAEVERRLRAVDPATGEGGLPASSVDQRLRDVHAELDLIRRTADSATRGRIEGLMRRLAGSVESLSSDAAPADFAALTPRELDVLTQVAIGCTNAAVGSRLGLGESTVKSYLHSATRKLGARNRVEAVTAARRRGLIP